MVYRELIEKITDYLSKEERYLQEMVAAKEQFFLLSGKVFEDDPFYENRMAAFVEWFMCDRPLTNIGLTPIQYYHSMFENSMERQMRQGLEALIASQHSLFLFKNRTSHTVAVEDLFDNKRYNVSEKRQYVGINRGSIFEGRIVMKDGLPMFSDTYCIHPLEACPLIRKKIEQTTFPSRDEFLGFIFELASMRLRCDRYKKVDIAKIYDFDQTRAPLIKSVPLAKTQP